MSHPPTVVGAMVLLTSGIVDDAWIADPVSPQYYPSGLPGGCGTWGSGSWVMGWHTVGP